MQPLEPTRHRLIKITWAFFWRWLLGGVAVIAALEFSKEFFSVNLSMPVEGFIILLAYAAIFYVILKNLLNKKIGDFRLVITKEKGDE